jgi:aromatic ring-opening dioxygenase LigB subunit
VDDAAVASRRIPPLFACTIPATLGPKAAVAIARALIQAVSDRGPVGLIAVADLSARRTEAAPGAFDPDAGAFDAGIARAFASGNLTALAELDPAQAAELQVGGRAVLQAVAGAMEGGGPLAGRVLYDEAPYGVGYLVGTLERRAVEAPGRAGERA